MNGSEILIQCLEREGVDVVFGYPGGAIMPVYDAELKHVLVRHEQAAVLAPDGYARATGKVGVCIATSGPGATNLVTGLANAFMDSVPLVAITGQVPTSLLGTDAFQEVDIFGITLPVVKHSFLVRRVEELAQVVHEAFRVARSGGGPVQCSSTCRKTSRARRAISGCPSSHLATLRLPRQAIRSISRHNSKSFKKSRRFVLAKHRRGARAR